MMGDSLPVRILEEMSSRPLSTSLEELLKPFVVQLATRLLHREAVEYRRQECPERWTEGGYAAAVIYCHHRKREIPDRDRPVAGACAAPAGAGRLLLNIQDLTLTFTSTTLNGDFHPMILLPNFSELDRIAALNGELPFIKHFEKSQQGIDWRMRWRQPLDNTLDLHGFSAREAHKAIEACLRTSLIEEHRYVDIIHGRGLRTSGGASILGILSRHWLSRSDVVEAFCTPDGYEGRVRARLTRRR